jgi:hypothetical protein
VGWGHLNRGPPMLSGQTRTASTPHLPSPRRPEGAALGREVSVLCPWAKVSRQWGLWLFVCCCNVCSSWGQEQTEGHMGQDGTERPVGEGHWVVNPKTPAQV